MSAVHIEGLVKRFGDTLRGLGAASGKRPA
jgi:hypothetical protein